VQYSKGFQKNLILGLFFNVLVDFCIRNDDEPLSKPRPEPPLTCLPFLSLSVRPRRPADQSSVVLSGLVVIRGGPWVILGSVSVIYPSCASSLKMPQHSNFSLFLSANSTDAYELISLPSKSALLATGCPTTPAARPSVVAASRDRLSSLRLVRPWSQIAASRDLIVSQAY